MDKSKPRLLVLSGEQVREQSRESLAKPAPVVEKLDEAEAQARDYGASLKQRYGLPQLQGLAVVALGVAYREHLI